MKHAFRICLATALIAAASMALAQQQQQPPSWEQMGRNSQNKQAFVLAASEQKQWKVPEDPVRIVGPIYSVGTRGLGCFLVATPKGLILINTGMPGSGPMIADAIRKLGFRPEDVRILLTNHGHVDHVGGHAWFVQLAGAQVYATRPDVAVMQSGGAGDYFYGDVPAFRYDPVNVDRVLGNGDRVRLGDVDIRVLTTPGHSMGATTFTMIVHDGGRRLSVVIPDGIGVNPGYRLLVDPNYPGIAADYEHSFRTLEALHPDIWLAAHTEDFGFVGKRTRAIAAGVDAWIDPAGYRTYLAGRRAVFEERLATEHGAPSAPRTGDAAH